jgi:hypothetical protein
MGKCNRWRNRDVVDRKSVNAAKWAAVFGMLGCACGMAQNELVLQEMDPSALILKSPLLSKFHLVKIPWH